MSKQQLKRGVGTVHALKIEGKNRGRKVGAAKTKHKIKSSCCVTFLLCDPGRYEYVKHIPKKVKTGDRIDGRIHNTHVLIVSTHPTKFKSIEHSSASLLDLYTYHANCVRWRFATDCWGSRFAYENKPEIFRFTINMNRPTGRAFFRDRCWLDVDRLGDIVGKQRFVSKVGRSLVVFAPSLPFAGDALVPIRSIRGVRREGRANVLGCGEVRP